MLRNKDRKIEARQSRVHREGTSRKSRRGGDTDEKKLRFGAEHFRESRGSSWSKGGENGRYRKKKRVRMYIRKRRRGVCTLLMRNWMEGESHPRKERAVGHSLPVIFSFWAGRAFSRDARRFLSPFVVLFACNIPKNKDSAEWQRFSSYSIFLSFSFFFLFYNLQKKKKRKKNWKKRKRNFDVWKFFLQSVLLFFFSFLFFSVIHNY